MQAEIAEHYHVQEREVVELARELVAAGEKPHQGRESAEIRHGAAQVVRADVQKREAREALKAWEDGSAQLVLLQRQDREVSELNAGARQCASEAHIRKVERANVAVIVARGKSGAAVSIERAGGRGAADRRSKRAVAVELRRGHRDLRSAQRKAP
ncbi:MAG: hypothetical protein IV100_28605 [Myxococcales bacterium]|nr:hypothetical protein [Myxococcales bacterium]